MEWNFYAKKLFFYGVGFCLMILNFDPILAHPGNPDDCVDGFTTEIISVEKDDFCTTVTLEIRADETVRYALSHFVVAIPCGNVTDAENSGNWKMEYMVTDPTTGLTGLKVDDISGIGENGVPATFMLTYTVCSEDEECLELITEIFNFSYKAGQCVFYEEVTYENDFQEPVEELEATLSVTPVSCYGMEDGTVFVTVEGGEPPYSYQWNNGANESGLSAVPAGTYVVMVSDANGSEIELAGVVTEPSVIRVVSQLTRPTCAESNGAIELSVSGGSGEYTYSWSHGPEVKDLYDLARGNYVVTVTDSDGCSVMRPFTLTSETPLQLSATINRLQCHETSSGTIDLEVTGGTEPYTFSWSNGATTQNLTGLNTGTYRVTVTDAEGCVQTRSFSVSREFFYASSDVTHAGCNGEGGAVVLEPTGGAGPYEAEWSSGDSGLEVDGLPAGQYSVTITDANGCRVSQQITIQVEDELDLNVSLTTPGVCTPFEDGVLVDLIVNQGTEPYSYLLDGEVTESSFIIDMEGEYLVEVTDANGCIASEVISVYFEDFELHLNTGVTQPDCFQPEVGSATVHVSGGTAPYDLFWNGEKNSSVRDDLIPGAYQIQVIDSNGCEAFEEIVIEEITVPSVTIEDPDEEVQCYSTDNVIFARVINGEEFFWSIDSDHGNWSISHEQITQVNYSSGDGSAVLTLVVTSIDGCEAMDAIELTCYEGSDNDDSNGDNSGDDDSNGDDSNGDDSGGDELPPSDDEGDAGEPDGDDSGDCITGCITLDKSVVNDTGNGCINYELTFVTDGSCRYDLSHLVIDLDGYTALNVWNSRNWKLEINSTDPKSGLNGIKVDDIEGFGKVYGDSFTVSFDLCDAPDFDASSYLIAFKAGRCLEIVEVYPETTTLQDGQLQLLVYPNPSVTDTWFEFVSTTDTHGKLILYNQTGVPVKTIFDAEITKGVTYRIKYSGRDSDGSILFYRMETGIDKKEGKILRIQ